MATLPCPCGFQGHPARECVCNPYQIRKYLAKISGPLLDRIDLHLEVPALKMDELTSEGEPAEGSAAIRARVQAARRIQKERFAPGAVHTNAQMGPRDAKRFCALDAAGKNLLKAAIQRLGLSARAYDRILKVARTIADLEGQESLRTPHLAEAIQYRSLDKFLN